MVSDVLDYKDILDSERFGIKRYKGGVTYKGELDPLNGKRDGKGV